MKKLMILFAIFTSVISAQLMNPKLIIQQNEYDFGNIKQGEKVSHLFELTNNGGDLLTITNVRPSCGCTAAMPEKNKLAPGESTKLKVTFNSSGRSGKQKKLVTITSNDPENPKQIITIKGVVIKPIAESAVHPLMAFSETEHDFGKVKEGKVVKYSFKFMNIGKSILEINDIKTSCGCTAALVSNEKLKPGEEGTLKVELNTSKRKGKMIKTVTVKSNDPKMPNKILTLYADVQ